MEIIEEKILLEAIIKKPDVACKLQVKLFSSPYNIIIPLEIVLKRRPIVLYTAMIQNIVLTMLFNLTFIKYIKQIKDRIIPIEVIAITPKFPPIFVT